MYVVTSILSSLYVQAKRALARLYGPKIEELRPSDLRLKQCHFWRQNIQKVM